MELNYDNLNAKICVMCAEAALVNYIYETQGAEARRVDFNDAADKLGCHWRTVSRYAKELVARKVLNLVNLGKKWGYQISPEIIKN